MNQPVITQISRLRRMTVGQLRDEWFRLYGEPTRSRNRDYLWKRLAWRVQELQHGGLTAEAKAKIDELAPDGFVRARTPANAIPDAIPDAPKPKNRRDRRLPSPGTVISKQYKGRELHVVVREEGFEFDGAMYGSATALAKAVTGSKSISGWLFLGLTKRKRN